MLFWVLSVLLVLGFLGSSLSGWTGLFSPWALSLYFLVFVDLVGLFCKGWIFLYSWMGFWKKSKQRVKHFSILILSKTTRATPNPLPLALLLLLLSPSPEPLLLVLSRAAHPQCTALLLILSSAGSLSPLQLLTTPSQLLLSLHTAPVSPICSSFIFVALSRHCSLLLLPSPSLQVSWWGFLWIV